MFEDEADKEDSKKGKKFFARSFIHQDWKSFRKKILGKGEVDFGGDFAWSGWSCLIDGYPTKTKSEQEGFEDCVTLEWACKEYDVEVEIESEEGGEGFEEEIKADKNGVNYDCKDMPSYECVCGNKQLIPSSYDVEEEECYECGRVGKWGDELKRMLEKKIENEEERDGNL